MRETARPQPARWRVLARLRSERGWSQIDLSERVGVDQSYISKLERGAVDTPRPHLRRALAAAFELDEDELLRLAGYDIFSRRQLAPESQAASGPTGDSEEGPDRGYDLRERVQELEHGLQEIGLELARADAGLAVHHYGFVPAARADWEQYRNRMDYVKVTRELLAGRRTEDLFALQVRGDDFTGLGIPDGAQLICEHANGCLPRDRQRVVVRLGEEYSIKQWCYEDGRIVLRHGDGSPAVLLEAPDAGEHVELAGFVVAAQVSFD